MGESMTPPETATNQYSLGTAALELFVGLGILGASVLAAPVVATVGVVVGGVLAGVGAHGAFRSLTDEPPAGAASPVAPQQPDARNLPEAQAQDETEEREEADEQEETDERTKTSEPVKAEQLVEAKAQAETEEVAETEEGAEIEEGAETGASAKTQEQAEQEASELLEAKKRAEAAEEQSRVEAAEKAEAERLAGEQARAEAARNIEAQRIADNQRLADEKAMVQLNKVAQALLVEVKGKKKGPPPGASGEETDAIEERRSAIRELLENELSPDRFKDAKTLTEALGKLVEATIEQVKLRAAAERQRQKQERQDAEDRQLREAAAAQAEALKVWQDTASQASSAIAGAEATLKSLQSILAGQIQLPAQRGIDSLEVLLKNGAAATPRKSEIEATKLLSAKLAAWSSTVETAYLSNAQRVSTMAKAVAGAVKAPYAKERSEAISSLLSLDADATQIAHVHDSLTAKLNAPSSSGGGTAAPRNNRPVVETYTVGATSLRDLASLLHNCRKSPDAYEQKPESTPNVATTTYSIYKYNDAGLEIHVHRLPNGRAQKAHVKSQSNAMVASTAFDNDIAVTDLAQYKISDTRHMPLS